MVADAVHYFAAAVVDAADAVVAVLSFYLLALWSLRLFLSCLPSASSGMAASWWEQRAAGSLQAIADAPPSESPIGPESPMAEKADFVDGRLRSLPHDLRTVEVWSRTAVDWFSADVVHSVAAHDGEVIVTVHFDVLEFGHCRKTLRLNSPSLREATVKNASGCDSRTTTPPPRNSHHYHLHYGKTGTTRPRSASTYDRS